MNTNISLVHNNAVVIFNDHYINLVEKFSGKNSSSLAKDTGISDDRQVFRLILEGIKTTLVS